jgi:hypothetical protein
MVIKVTNSTGTVVKTEDQGLDKLKVWLIDALLSGFLNPDSVKLCIKLYELSPFGKEVYFKVNHTLCFEIYNDNN